MPQGGPETTGSSSLAAGGSTATRSPQAALRGQVTLPPCLLAPLFSLFTPLSSPPPSPLSCLTPSGDFLCRLVPRPPLALQHRPAPEARWEGHHSFQAGSTWSCPHPLQHQTRCTGAPAATSPNCRDPRLPHFRCCCGRCSSPSGGPGAVRPPLGQWTPWAALLAGIERSDGPGSHERHLILLPLGKEPLPAPGWGITEGTLTPGPAPSVVSRGRWHPWSSLGTYRKKGSCAAASDPEPGPPQAGAQGRVRLAESGMVGCGTSRGQRCGGASAAGGLGSPHLRSLPEGRASPSGLGACGWSTVPDDPGTGTAPGPWLLPTPRGAENAPGGGDLIGAPAARCSAPKHRNLPLRL